MKIEFGLIKSICLVLVVFVWSSSIYSQNSKIDSLKQLLQNNIRVDSKKVDLLNELSFSFRRSNPDSLLKYAKEAKNLSLKLDYNSGQGRSLFLQGIHAFDKHELDNALEYFEKSVSVYSSLHDYDGLADCYFYLAKVSYLQEETLGTLEYCKKILDVIESIESCFMKAYFLNFVADMYNFHHHYQRAIEILQYSIKVSITNEQDFTLGRAYMILGISYYRLKNFPEALVYFNKALDLYDTLEDSRDETVSQDKAVILKYVGHIYIAQGRYDDAHIHLNLALQIFKKYNNYRNIATCIANTAVICKNEGQYNGAIALFEEAIVQYKKHNMKTNMFSSLISLGDIYFLRGEYQQSQQTFKDAIALHKEIKRSSAYPYLGLSRIDYAKDNYKEALKKALISLDIIEKNQEIEHKEEIYEQLGFTYAKLGMYEEAYKNKLRYIALKDSIDNKEITRRIAELEAEYKYKDKIKSAEVREKDLNQKVLESDRRLIKTQNQKLLAIIGVLLLAVITLVILFVSRVRIVKSESKNILAEQKLLRSQMTPHFAFNALANLQGIILNKEYPKSLEYLSHFSRLLRLTLENSRNQMVLLKDELLAVESYMEIQNLTTCTPYVFEVILCKSVDPSTLWIPPMLIQPFVENAVEHAFMEDNHDKHITITLSFVEDKQLKCCIRDNGIGLNSLHKNDTSSKKPLATQITTERLNILSKILKTKSNISTVDQTKHNKKGTLVTLLLPYKLALNDFHFNCRR